MDNSEADIERGSGDRTDLILSEEYISSITPDTNTFIGLSENYTNESVNLDNEAYDAFTKSKWFVSRDSTKTSALMERLFIAYLTTENWLEEKYTYDKIDTDKFFVPLTVVPASKIDDCFNHLDMIATIRTGGVMFTEFGIDVTCNPSVEDLAKKFSYIHRMGLKDRHRANEVSDFGFISEESTDNGEIISKLMPHQSRLCRGLKIPGFAMAKYYENLRDDDNDKRTKGQISIMPRFIVGCSNSLIKIAGGEWNAEIAELSREKQNLEMVSGIGSQLSEADRQKHEERILEIEDKMPPMLKELVDQFGELTPEVLNEAMKACMILEIRYQIDLLKKIVDTIYDNASFQDNNSTDAKGNGTIRLSISQSHLLNDAKRALDKLGVFFEKAQVFMESLATANKNELTAKGIEIAKNDPVYLAIIEQARKTYLEGDYGVTHVEGDNLYSSIRNLIRSGAVIQSDDEDIA